MRLLSRAWIAVVVLLVAAAGVSGWRVGARSLARHDASWAPPFVPCGCAAIPSVPPGAADCVVVEKARRTLTVFRGGRVLDSFAVSLGRAPEGQKERQGDMRTPEGCYTLTRSASTRYHAALDVSYPTPAQVRQARQSGIDPGGEIQIHGLPPAVEWIGPLHLAMDWTQGCIAVTSRDIDALRALVRNGTPIEIRQ